ncbi:hypothetical protein, partial [Rhodovarius lipocyclicus]|uniref:hypothetical protein n=1 Tax=Rhodovarius lipocyclicus TaxID=268410 RepID=UPI001F23B39E
INITNTNSSKPPAPATHPANTKNISAQKRRLLKTDTVLNQQPSRDSQGSQRNLTHRTLSGFQEVRHSGRPWKVVASATNVNNQSASR